jgi:uncharacterized membrane protein
MTFAVGPISSLVVAIIAIVFGIVVMVKPKILAYMVGAYLIIIGALFFIQRYFL